MTNKIPKPAYQILLGFLFLVFAVIACNSKAEKKETVTDTAIVKPADDVPPPPPPVEDTAKKMDAPTDTVKKKPVKDPS